MMLMARDKGRSLGLAAGRGCSVGGVEVSSMPRREPDSHSLNLATYAVARKFRRSDKFAQQEKSPAAPGEGGAEGGVQAHS
jgi:hypothetical protein